MPSRSETVEKMIGRRATSCLGFFLLVLVLLMILALLSPWLFPKEKPANAPTPPVQQP
jgi:hypothetical protein